MSRPATHEIGVANYKNGTTEIFIRRTEDGEGVDLFIEGLSESKRKKLEEITPSCVYHPARAEAVAEIVDGMTGRERKTLQFLEECEVSNRGKVNPRELKKVDWESMCRWREEGFIDFGRLSGRYVHDFQSHWVELSSLAFDVAIHLRSKQIKWSRANPDFSKAKS